MFKIVSFLSNSEEAVGGWFSQRVDPSLLDIVVVPEDTPEDEVCVFLTNRASGWLTTGKLLISCRGKVVSIRRCGVRISTSHSYT